MSKLKKIFIALLLVPQLLISTGGLQLATVHAQPATEAPGATAPTNNAPVQHTWYNQTYDEWYLKTYDTNNPTEIFGERYTAAQTQWIMYGLFTNIALLALGGNQEIFNCVLSGDLSKCANAFTELTQVSENIKAPESDKSLFALLLEDRDISGISYVKNTAKRFHIVPTANAQTPGFGFQALSVTQKAWTSMRDIAFSFFVIVSIIFAFMIMFRVKISPQAAITVQSALPRLVVAIILVTFSYAICGFMVDIMYVFIGLISLFFSRLPIAGFYGPSPADLFKLITQGPQIGVLTGAFETHTGIIGLFITYWINFIVVGVVSIALSIVNIGANLANLQIGTAVGGSILTLLFTIIGILALILILLWAIISFFRVAFMLIKNFALVLMLTIFSPLYLLLGVISPSFSIGSFIRTYLGKLAVFPAVGVFFLLALWILNLSLEVLYSAVQQNAQAAAQAASLTGLIQRLAGQNTLDGNALARYAAGWPPLLGGSPEILAFVIAVASVAVIFQTPKAAQIVEGIISGQGFKLESAIGTQINEAWGATALGVAGAKFFSQRFGKNSPQPGSKPDIEQRESI